jgi:sugar-phosphatase
VLIARALLLDMDGTLVDSHAVVRRVWRRWCEEHGFDFETVIVLAQGRQAQSTMAELMPERPVEENMADNRALVAAEIDDIEGIVPIRGAADFLAAVAGFPQAMVTSATTELATRRMAAAGLTVPAVAITAEQVARSKPDPEGFLLGAAALGFAPADCVVFEDSAAGITAARAAGMAVVGVGPESAAFGPDLQVDDLTRLIVRRRGDTVELTT